jgi:hypothetical protein
MVREPHPRTKNSISRAQNGARAPSSPQNECHTHAKWCENPILAPKIASHAHKMVREPHPRTKTSVTRTQNGARAPSSHQNKCHTHAKWCENPILAPKQVSHAHKMVREPHPRTKPSVTRTQNGARPPSSPQNSISRAQNGARTPSSHQNKCHTHAKWCENLFA